MMQPDYDLVIFFGGTAILLLSSISLAVFLIIHKRKRYEHLLEKQQMENNYQQQLLLSRMEVQEQSFKYFSEEIHDNIGQVLSIVKMQLYSIRSKSTEPEISNKAGDCTELLGKAINDLRNISHTLNSSFVQNAGLVDAIEKDLAYICSAKDVGCKLHVTGEEYSLGGERELLIFRIVQEAIANALKHAMPTSIDVYLDYYPQALKLRISDDGAGFEPASLDMNGIGLVNMHVRSELLKGRLDVQSAKDKGTMISLEIEK